MNANGATTRLQETARGSHRHSILDLAPLELECMSILWDLGDGTVRDIHARLAESRPRAYTTVMTIMDRLARKGVVTRCKLGRAYRYHPQLSAEEARIRAVEKVVKGFFQGSVAALAAHLAERQDLRQADAAGASGSVPSASNTL